jgi:elongation factor 2
LSTKLVPELLKIMKNKEQIRNIGIIAHIDHGKTTLADSFLANSGLLSPSIVGKARALDYLDEEQLRGITIKSATISLLHSKDEKAFVINLVDTPGHVDFSGKVNRALRAIDGAIVVVDAVEEVMVQTETVTRQALQERVKPVLFINKIDRLVNELKLTPEEIQEKIKRIVLEFNTLIELYAEEEYRNEWKVSITNGTVVFGSALHRWALSSAITKKKGIKFSNVLQSYHEEKLSELAETIPVHEAVLDMVIDHLPNPTQAQAYRIPRIWQGDLTTEAGQSMTRCDENGPLVMCVHKIIQDPHAGRIATGRIFSGTLKVGDQVYSILSNRNSRITQVSMFMGAQRKVVEGMTAGNIVALAGVGEVLVGETIINQTYVDQIIPFESIPYVSEPVMTIAVEPKLTRQLPELAEIIEKLSIQDPNLVHSINQETGEVLLSGLGELHLEIAIKEIEKEGVEVIASKPLILYRESISHRSPLVIGSDSEGYNKIKLIAEPLNEKSISLIADKEITEKMDRQKITKILIEKANWSKGEARSILFLDNFGNVLINNTSGVPFFSEAKAIIAASFKQTIQAGPLAQEHIRGVKIIMEDLELDHKTENRSPSLIIPMVRYAIFDAILKADPVLLEPLYKIQVRIPSEFIGRVTSVLNKRRGKISESSQKGHIMTITGTIPVATTLNLTTELRAETSGYAFFQTVFLNQWSPLSPKVSQEVIHEIRSRRGLRDLPDID